ncbi:MAG: dicarboxylate/amino acid:cation symporter [Deltaproteobacteria bacterium]|nr:dicarboxylate/amino acid:cation symporter [Deltaproteobacteria bacterium]
MKRHSNIAVLIGLVAGAVLGITANATLAGTPFLAGFIESFADPAGKIFLRLLLMLVIPLVFAGLANAIASFELRDLGKLGLKTLAYTVVVSTIAVLIGIAFVNLFQPGVGLSDTARAALTEAAAKNKAAFASAAAPPSGIAMLISIVPENPFKAAATGDMLAVMFFALFFGIGLALTRTASSEKLREVLEGLFDVSMRLIGVVIRLAPIGVGALVFTMTARLGTDILAALAKYVLVVVGALALHQFGVYSLSVALLARRSPLRFFADIRLAMLTAFSTASSNATLPTAIDVAEKNLRLPPRVARFVLTIGAIGNQNGTALFEGVTVLFLAQLYGIDLSLSQQITVVGVAILGGIGTAGVPAGSLPVVMMLLGMVGVPAEGIGMILGVDRFLDMCRTTLNVTGDLAAAVVVARGYEPPTEKTEPAS